MELMRELLEKLSTKTQKDVLTEDVGEFVVIDRGLGRALVMAHQGKKDDAGTEWVKSLARNYTRKIPMIQFPSRTPADTIRKMNQRGAIAAVLADDKGNQFALVHRAAPGDEVYHIAMSLDAMEKALSKEEWQGLHNSLMNAVKVYGSVKNRWGVLDRNGIDEDELYVLMMKVSRAMKKADRGMVVHVLKPNMAMKESVD